MKDTASRQRGYSNLRVNYNIRRHLKNALISICLFSLPVALLLNFLAGVCYGY